jgi:predicted SnoaL-like aldol condensation-catalyzing enzyme
MSNKSIVIAAVNQLFGEKDPGAVAAYFGPVYTQHSALAPDGVAGVMGLASNLPPAFRYELLRTLADGPLVVTQGLYYGFGPVPVIGFDVWRVENDRIVEHWDALAPLTDPSQVSGQTEPEAGANGAVNKAIVEAWMTGLVGGGAAVPATLETDHATASSVPEYTTVHHVIADGDFVFTRSEGVNGVASILNDLWRVESGAIVEHWAGHAPVPATLPHSNGAF